MKALVLLAGLMLLLTGCGGPNSGSYSAETASPASDSAAWKGDGNQMTGAVANESQEGARAQPVVLENRLVIRTAELAVRVKNVESAEDSVGQIVATHGGYVSGTSSSDFVSENPSLNLNLRIPAGSFDQVIEELEKLGTRTSKITNSEDVTEQVVDMDARIKTLTAQEESLRNLLAKAQRLQDIMDLQDKLTQVRGTIESIAAQRKSLATRAALSTINLTLQQSAVPHQGPQDPNWLAQAWGEATTRLGVVFRSVAVFGIWALVFSPFWVPLLILIWRGIRGMQPKAPPQQL